MIVAQMLDIIDDNINVYVHDKLTKELITYYDGKHNIGTHVLVDTVEGIYTTDNGGIVLEIMYNAVDFDDLNGEAKINCMWDYMYELCPYEHFEHLSFTELEDCVREFWRQSEYTLDRKGNWYDEDFNRI